MLIFRAATAAAVPKLSRLHTDHQKRKKKEKAMMLAMFDSNLIDSDYSVRTFKLILCVYYNWGCKLFRRDHSVFVSAFSEPK